MDIDVARRIAAQVNESMKTLENLLPYIKANTSAKEQAIIIQAIGDIFSIRSDCILSTVVSACPELRTEIMPWLDDRK